jgi:hypothetical protein
MKNYTNLGLNNNTIINPILNFTFNNTINNTNIGNIGTFDAININETFNNNLSLNSSSNSSN